MHGWEQQGVSQCREEQVGRPEDGQELLHGHVGKLAESGDQQWVQG